MNKIITKKDQNYIKNIVIKAGNRALKLQKKNLQIMRKDDSSIVTETDIAIQEELLKKLYKKFSNINYIYEEGYNGKLSKIDSDTISIVIDPIDGTAMYSMYLPVWCVSVGIFKGSEPLHGFVYAPGFDMLFYNDETTSYINKRKIMIDPTMKVDTESNVFYASDVGKEIDIVFPGKVRNLGSTALHACLVTDNMRNRTAAFIGKSFIWDWAGAIPIIKKAGGDIRYADGKQFNFLETVNNDGIIESPLIAYSTKDFNTIKKYFIKK